MIPGKYQGTIEENDVRSAGSGTAYVFLRVNMEGGSMPISVWLSEKALNMARAQMKACGYDLDKDGVEPLAKNTALLSGRTVPVEVYEEEYRGRLTLKARIQTAAVSGRQIASIEKMLRESREAEAAPGQKEELDDIPF